MNTVRQTHRRKDGRSVRVKVIHQYEHGILFRWGRVLPGVREPGLTWVNPFIDRLTKVNMQTVVSGAGPGGDHP
jgi:regulator of protease activity HflC (stomatin/prohibitin superfamily)